MSRYLIKIPVVDAVKFEPNELAPSADLPAGVQYDGLDHAKVKHWSIPTPVGNFRVEPGDYLVTSGTGLSVVKPDVFAAAFDPAVEAVSTLAEVVPAPAVK